MSRIGALYLASSFATMAAMQTAVLLCKQYKRTLTVPEERAVFMREQASSLYDAGPYFFAKVLAEFPFSLVDPLILSLLMYWLVGFNTTDASKFFVFCILYLLM